MRAVIVGASSGLGRCIAAGLGKRGARVALLARRKDRLEDAAAEAGPNALAIPCDVTDGDSCRDAIAQAASGLGGIESLANGAVPGRIDALAPQGGGRMQVADRNGERVGCVGRLGRLGKGQQAGHHRLHLLLPGFTVAHDRGLDGKRGVLCHLESCDSSGKHGDASDLPEFERRLHVQRVKNIFDCDLVRLMLANQLLETKIDSLKTGGHRFARREFDRAAG